MQLTQTQVQKIAKLARLGLSEAETDQFATQLSDIFEYAELLNEVDTGGVAPVSQITGLQDVFFEDEVMDCPVIPQLLAQSPQMVVEGMIQVKRIL